MKENGKKLYVYQYNTKLELVKRFDSILAAAKENQISNTSIYKSILGERNLAGGYFWYRGCEPLQEIPEKWVYYIENDGKLGNKSKHVVQIDLDGCVVAEYDSIRKAAKALGVIERGISRAINGKSKTSCGYRWKCIK